MPYKIISSGIQIDEEYRTGSADSVRRSLEYISTLTDQKIIGVFDNDRQGNEQFKGLNNQIFEPHDINKRTRKHLKKDIYGYLLPVPQNRTMFVTEGSLNQRYFVIEHYFSDHVLEGHNIKGESILGTDVFEIRGNKNAFSQDCEQLKAKEFERFKTLFEDLNALIA